MLLFLYNQITKGGANFWLRIYPSNLNLDNASAGRRFGHSFEWPFFILGTYMENIEINNLSFQYGKSRPILNKINLTIPLHSFSLLEGPTGSGKSTFLKILAGLYPKYGGKLTSGKIHINNQRVAMMFQDPGEQFTMTTAREEIIFALENLNVSAQEYPIRLQEAISFAKLDKLVDRKINNLSGGEKQRVALGVLVAMQVDFFY